MGNWNGTGTAQGGLHKTGAVVPPLSCVLLVPGVPSQHCPDQGPCSSPGNPGLQPLLGYVAWNVLPSDVDRNLVLRVLASRLLRADSVSLFRSVRPLTTTLAHSALSECALFEVKGGAGKGAPTRPHPPAEVFPPPSLRRANLPLMLFLQLFAV